MDIKQIEKNQEQEDNNDAYSLYLYAIRSPFDRSIKDIEQILNDKIKWISQKQKDIQREKPEIIKPTFEDHSTLPYLGKNCDLKIIDIVDKSEERIEYFNNSFSVYLDKKKSKMSIKQNHYMNNGYSLKLIKFLMKRSCSLAKS